MCDHVRLEMTYISERDIPGRLLLDVRCVDCGACGSSALRAADFEWEEPAAVNDADAACNRFAAAHRREG